MSPVYCIFVLGLAWIALADFNSQEKSCPVTDMECLKNVAQIFMNNISVGNPEYGTKTIDPITIPAIDKFPEGTEISFHYKDLKVTGFKNQKISSIKLDKETRMVNLKIKVDFNFDSDLTVKLHCHDPPKVFLGTLQANASAEGIAVYGFSLITDDKGVKHFEMEPETITCEVLENPTFTPDDGLQNLTVNDPDAHVQYNKYKNVQQATRQEIMCDIMKTVFATLINNMRVVARALPTSAFITNI